MISHLWSNVHDYYNQFTIYDTQAMNTWKTCCHSLSADKEHVEKMLSPLYVDKDKYISQIKSLFKSPSILIYKS